MAYQQLLPHPGIADSIKCFWTIRKFCSPEQSVFEILPDSYAELIFNFGTPCYLLRGNLPVRLPNPFLVGLLDSPIYIQATGELHVTAVRIYPWAIFSVTGNLPFNKNGFKAGLYNDLTAILNQNVNDGNLLNCMNGYFQKHLHQPEKTLAAAGRIINETNGTVKLKTLAGLVNSSSRKVQRLFQQATGQSAKAVARRLRFELVRDRIWLNPEVKFTQMAYELGFADQAHLNHEFRSFSKKRPANLQRNVRLQKSILTNNLSFFYKAIIDFTRNLAKNKIMKSTLNSINLMAKEPTQLKDFYVNVFGLEENMRRSHAPGFYMIDGGKGCNILIQDAGGVHSETGVKGFELGIEMETVDELKERVINAGGSIINDTQQMGWGTAITVADPEGHAINAYVFKLE